MFPEVIKTQNIDRRKTEKMIFAKKSTLNNQASIFVHPVFFIFFISIMTCIIHNNIHAGTKWYKILISKRILK